MKALAITGGVGGAKLALGLASILGPHEVEFLVNTGDDFEHFGLHISPDVDTLLYTLAGLASQDHGWGRSDESWNCLESIRTLNGETWFQLGDKDLGLHLTRTKLLRDNHSLTEVVHHIGNSLGISHRVYPMSDSPVRTIVETTTGDMEFQQYFVKERCEPVVSGFRFEGIETARPVAQLLDQKFESVIICPSNPFVSVDPILAVPGMRQYLLSLQVPIVAVSPIVQGQALKGPTVKMMSELNFERSNAQIGRHYEGLLSGLIIDQLDKDSASSIRALGMEVKVDQTVMKSLEDKTSLAQSAVDFATSLIKAC